MPKILFAIFAGQKDEVRINASEVLSKYENMPLDEEIIEQIIEQVWNQYDYDHKGFLNITEAYDFLSIVLQLNENMLAKSVGREAQDITEEHVRQQIKLADANKDNKLSRLELQQWVKKHLKADNQVQMETQLMI